MWEKASQFFLKMTNKMQHMNVTVIHRWQVLAFDRHVLHTVSGATRPWQVPCEHQRWGRTRAQADQKRFGKGDVPRLRDQLLEMKIMGNQLESVQCWWAIDPRNIPLNVLIVGPRNYWKSQLVVNELYCPFCSKFDHIVLLCPTFAFNKPSTALVKRTRGCLFWPVSSNRWKLGWSWRAGFLRAWMLSWFSTIGPHRKMWKGVWASWLAWGFLPSLSASASGCWPRNTPASLLLSVRTWLQLGFFAHPQQEIRKPSLMIWPGTCPRRSTRIWFHNCLISWR